MWRYLFLQQVDVSPHKDDLSFSIREEASRRRKKERGRKLRRYLLIGLATLGGGTVIGDYSCFRISKSPESNDNQLIIKSTKTKEKLSEFSSWHIVALTSFCILYWLIYFFFLPLPGVTGGLAAPLVAAGAGAVLGAGGAAALGSVTGIAIMASLFGAAGAGLTGKSTDDCADTNY